MAKKIVRKADKCVCNEVAAKVGFGESRTFSCKVHGTVTIDKKRSYTQPINAPQVTTWPKYPTTIPSVPYFGDPMYPNGPTCQSNQSVGSTYRATGNELITFTQSR